jgi:hypothetical protein
MAPLERSFLANELSVFALNLGRLVEARGIRRLDDGWRMTLGKPTLTSIGYQHSGWVAFGLGRLPEVARLAGNAVIEAETASNSSEKKNSLMRRAITAHALGDVAAARADFAAATELEGEPLYSQRGGHHARHNLDLGDLAAAGLLSTAA